MSFFFTIEKAIVKCLNHCNSTFVPGVVCKGILDSMPKEFVEGIYTSCNSFLKHIKLSFKFLEHLEFLADLVVSCCEAHYYPSKHVLMAFGRALDPCQVKEKSQKVKVLNSVWGVVENLSDLDDFLGYVGLFGDNTDTDFSLQHVMTILLSISGSGANISYSVPKPV